MCFTNWIHYIYILKKRLLPEFCVSLRFFDLSYIVLIAKSGIWVLISNLNSIMIVGLDLIIANILIDSSAMGRLSVSKLIPTVIGNILGSLYSVFTASFTKTYALCRDNLCNEITFSFRILGLLFIVPFAGIIVFGQSFFNLWLPKNTYSLSDYSQIYILMILALINVIINAFMYSIFSLFITLNKIKHYSILILCFSLLSIISTILLVLFTNLGVYAIAGTSTMVLGLVNLIVIPLYAEKVSSAKPFTYIKSIFKNHFSLFIVITIFKLIRPTLLLNTWRNFIISVSIVGIIGYMFSFMILLNKTERKKAITVLYSKLKK